MEERAVQAFAILREADRLKPKTTPKQAISQVSQMGYTWDKTQWVKFQQANLLAEVADGVIPEPESAPTFTFAEAVAYLHAYDENPLGNLVLEDEVARFYTAIKTISAATGLNDLWLGGVLFEGNETIESLQAAAKADPLYSHMIDNPFA